MVRLHSTKAIDQKNNLFLIKESDLQHFFDAWDHSDNPCQEEGEYGGDDANEEEFTKGPHPDTIHGILQNEH